jgi:hypothetical protein
MLDICFILNVSVRAFVSDLSKRRSIERCLHFTCEQCIRIDKTTIQQDPCSCI